MAIIAAIITIVAIWGGITNTICILRASAIIIFIAFSTISYDCTQRATASIVITITFPVTTILPIRF
jgi:hypothetical protein